MKTNKTQIIAHDNTQELFIIREFDAPRALVFRAFSEPELLVQWMGPKELEMRIDKHDHKSHGSYRFVHKDSLGNEFAFNGAIHEVSEPERIIRTFEFEGLPEKGHVVLEFLTLEACSENKTKVTMQSVFKSVADRDGMIQSGMERGVNEGFEALDTLLKSQTIKTQ